MEWQSHFNPWSGCLCVWGCCWVLLLVGLGQGRDGLWVLLCVRAAADADTGARAVQAPMLRAAPVDPNPFVDTGFPLQSKLWGFHSCP